MLYNDECPRNSWLEQAVLADKLGSGPSLTPSIPTDRILMWGLLNELLAEDGIVWNKRLLFGNSPLTQKYGYTEVGVKEAPQRIVESLQVFVDQIRAQRSAGSAFIIVSSLSLLDVYFATTTVMFALPAPEVMPVLVCVCVFDGGCLHFCFAHCPVVCDMLPVLLLLPTPV